MTNKPDWSILSWNQQKKIIDKISFLVERGYLPQDRDIVEMAREYYQRSLA